VPREDVIKRLKQQENAIRAFGVGALYLFGSHARDEARADSDVDIFVDRDPARKFGFLELTNLEFFLSDTLGTKTDVMTRTSLHPDLRAEIESSAIKVF
jgi:hypothetical protein